MATKVGRSARTNSLITVLSIIGILVLLNALGVFVFGRADLTDNARYSLSDVSKDAVNQLDGLDVQVFISKDLPTSIAAGYGRTQDIRGVDRDLLDKLNEYQSYSNGKMRITVVADDIEGKAEKAKLELFTGKEAAVEAGRLEFKKYALGATFSYRNQMEVLPLAIEPAYFEFEVTKILLRLKEKYEKSKDIEDILAIGDTMGKSAEECQQQIDSYKSEDEKAQGGLALLMGQGGGFIDKMRGDVEGLRRACEGMTIAKAKLETMSKKNDLLEQLRMSGDAAVEALDGLVAMLMQPNSDKNQIVAMVDRLGQIITLVTKDRDTLKNSPGRKAVGFICGHKEFCPFSATKPLVQPEIAGMLGQQNPMIQQFVGQVSQIEQQIDSINEQLRRGLFTRRGLDLKRIESGQDIPDDVEALVIFGAQEPLPERDLYKIDQFLLSGRSVIVFVNTWDVSVYNFQDKSNSIDGAGMTADKLERVAHPTNLDAFLANYGVQLNRDIVVEPKNYDDITIIQLQKQGQYTVQSQRAFGYPILPSFDDMDRSHVLVRRLPSITLPYASTMSVTDEARGRSGLNVVELIKTSPEAIATNEDIELSPPYLVNQLPTLVSNGPKTVAMAIQGPFTSYFKGKEVPEYQADEKTAERPFRDGGEGRLLVIGSDMGLENLSTDTIMPGFTMSKLTSGQADFFVDLKNFVANFQNWQLRLSQISGVIQGNLEFVFNALDWGIQNEALVDIRSKGFTARPIQAMSDGARTGLILFMIVGLPGLFAMLGVLRFVRRRRGK